MKSNYKARLLGTLFSTTFLFSSANAWANECAETERQPATQELIDLVNDNRDLKNDLSELPWKHNQYFEAENYLEAVGIMQSIKAGVNLGALKRPMDMTKIV